MRNGTLVALSRKAVVRNTVKSKSSWKQSSIILDAFRERNYFIFPNSLFNTFKKIREKEMANCYASWDKLFSSGGTVLCDISSTAFWLPLTLLAEENITRNKDRIPSSVATHHSLLWKQSLLLQQFTL